MVGGGREEPRRCRLTSRDWIMSSSEDVKRRAERGWMKDLCLNMQAKSQAASGPAYYTALLTTQLSPSNETHAEPCYFWKMPSGNRENIFATVLPWVAWKYLEALPLFGHRVESAACGRRRILNPVARVNIHGSHKKRAAVRSRMFKFNRKTIFFLLWLHVTASYRCYKYRRTLPLVLLESCSLVPHYTDPPVEWNSLIWDVAVKTGPHEHASCGYLSLQAKDPVCLYSRLICKTAKRHGRFPARSIVDLFSVLWLLRGCWGKKKEHPWKKGTSLPPSPLQMTFLL